MPIEEKDVEQWLLDNPEETDLMLARLNIQRKSVTTLETENFLFDIAHRLTSSLNVDHIVQYVLECAIKLIHAEKCSVFLLDEKAQELYSIAFDVGNGDTALASGSDSVRIKIGTGIAGKVAKEKAGQNIPDVYQNPDFNASMDKKFGTRTKSMLCFPIMETNDNSKDNLIGVSYLINKIDEDGNRGVEFSKKDEHTFKKFLVLVGLAIKNARLYTETQNVAEENHRLYRVSQKETEKNILLLDMARKLGAEIDTDAVIQSILGSASKMISADHAVIYLVDSATGDLKDVAEGMNPIVKKIAKEVQLIEKSIHVQDVSKDPRYDDGNDVKLSYKTKNVLAAPCLGPKGRVLGIACLINKRDHNSNELMSFDYEDKKLLDSFAIFCGLTLHKAMLFDEINLQKQKMSIVMELMCFHSKTRDEETQNYLANAKKIKIASAKMSQYDFDPHVFQNIDDTLVVICHNMFKYLDYDHLFKLNEVKLIEYLLTVRRNYRPVAYHNFTHATSVTHTLYLFIVNGILDEYLDKLTMFSMLIAALNHDIDHRGTNNSFQQKTGSVLANFYGTSTMERHHFNHAMTILNSSSGLNILENLDPVSYRKCLGLIEHSILATDLGLFFGNKKKVEDILEKKQFSKDNPEHIALLRSIVMTCSDLGALFKPFEKSKPTADSVYEEFFQQGDAEKSMGLPFSSELTNREKASEIPRMQVGFFKFVVLPAYGCLKNLLGEKVGHIYQSCLKNLEEWQKLQDCGKPYIHKDHRNPNDAPLNAKGTSNLDTVTGLPLNNSSPQSRERTKTSVFIENHTEGINDPINQMQNPRRKSVLMINPQQK